MPTKLDTGGWDGRCFLCITSALALLSVFIHAGFFDWLDFRGSPAVDLLPPVLWLEARGRKEGSGTPWLVWHRKPPGLKV
jgi:hypothetical protein